MTRTAATLAAALILAGCATPPVEPGEAPAPLCVVRDADGVIRETPCAERNEQ